MSYDKCALNDRGGTVFVHAFMTSRLDNLLWVVCDHKIPDS